MLRIGLDVAGGDFAPDATLGSLLLLEKEVAGIATIVLFGDEGIISDFLSKHPQLNGFTEIVHAPQLIGMGEKPVKAFLGKPDSSIVVGFDHLKKGKIDAFASAGNSGVMMVGAVHVINTIPGVIRPASVILIPKINGGFSLLLDVGTNPDAKHDVLYQYGFLGSVFATAVLGIEDPKVGLLSIGAEEKKGNLLVQSTFPLMKETTSYNFVGNVEGRDLFNDKADVVVCDGFTGNIVIKQIQAMYRIMEKRGLLDDYFCRFNYELQGGSPLIGINGNVVIGHGISSPLAIKNMVLLAKNIAESKLYLRISDAMRNFPV